jgi:hypothetical protein
MKVLRIFIVAALLLIAISAAGFRRIAALPGEFPLQANRNWGDKDYRTLYITANSSVYRLEMKTQGFVPYL